MMPRGCVRFRRPPTSALVGGVGFDISRTQNSGGKIDLMVDGADLSLWRKEVGGHRWQHTSGIGRKARTHTSTVTVAVIPVVARAGVELRDCDLSIEKMRGSGAGGQHRNVTESAVRVRHIPSGLEARICSERSQHQNMRIAREVLIARLSQMQDGVAASSLSAERAKAGSGMRGDKIRTYRECDDLVTDHVTGQKFRLRDFMRGSIPGLSS